MKIQIDTIEKIIRIETTENLGELFDKLNQMLPCGLWREFKLETNTVVEWHNPIIWKEIYPPVTPYPWPTPYYPTYPWITCDSIGEVLYKGTFDVIC